jgi:O-antigen/teichoic acid export membrane protein
MLMLYSLRRQAPRLFHAQGHWNKGYARNLVQPALRAWAFALGWFMVVQTSAYFIASLRNPADIPTYQAAYSLLANLYLLATTLAVTSTVFLSHAWQAGDYESVRRLTLRFAQVGMAIMAAGVGFILIAGRDFIEVWLGAGSFVGYGVVLVFCTIYTLEAQAGILLACARSTEDERYAISALCAGAINLVLALLLIGPLGVLGVALSMMIAQLLTNHWYGVYRPMKRLGIHYGTYLKRVVLLWALTLAVTVLSGYLLIEQMRQFGARRLWIIALAASVAGSTLSAVLWWGVFEKGHRQKVLRAAARQIDALGRLLR